MKKLMRVTRIHCCDSETEADQIIKEDAEKGILIKKSVEVKIKKKSGEIIGEKLKVTTVVEYDTDWFNEDDYD